MALFKTDRVGPAPFISVDHAGRGELVVLMHGIGGNKRNWADNIPLLAEHFHVVAWDARGWGESDDYEGPLTFDDLARDLSRVIQFFGHDKAHILGISMGGRIAMHFADLFPAKVRSLILCDTTRSLQHWTEEQRSAFIRSRKEPLLNGRSPADIALDVSRPLVGPNTPPEILAKLVDSIARLHKESYIKAIDANVHLAPPQRLGAIQAPTLVMAGEFDTQTPPEEARVIADCIPGSRYAVIANAGHLVNLEQPEAFNAEVLAFLLEQRGRQDLPATGL